MKLLVIDDDVSLLKLIKNALQEQYIVTTCSQAKQLDSQQFSQFDLIILDVMMPELTGFDFLKQYRQVIDCPILLLTAKDFEMDKVNGFALGADDYMTKPFSISELRARVAAHLRREKRQKHRRLIDLPITCDLIEQALYCRGELIPLTASEYKICELLLQRRGQVFEKEAIYTAIYGYEALGDAQTSITERVKHIRQKCFPFGINPIYTVWGVGYKWQIEKV